MSDNNDSPKMTDYNPISMDNISNDDGEEYNEEKKRKAQDEQEEGGTIMLTGGQSNGHVAGATLVDFPPPMLLQNLSNSISNNINNNIRRNRIIDRPNSFDVLCGRGKAIQSHPGNIILHRIVDKECERYHSAPRLNRRSIANEIVQAIKNSKQRFEQQIPGRFIRQEKDHGDAGGGGHGGAYWKEISEDEARDKVSHCFRARRLLMLLNKDKSKTTERLFVSSSSSPSRPPEVIAVVMGASAAVPPLSNGGGDDDMLFDPSSSFPAVRYADRTTPSHYYSHLQQHQQQPQPASYQLPQQETNTLGEGGYHQQQHQPSLQMLAYHYASSSYHGAPPLLGGGGTGAPPPPSWTTSTIRDPNPSSSTTVAARKPPQPEQGHPPPPQADDDNGQQQQPISRTTNSQDTWERSAEETSLPFLYRGAGDPSSSSQGEG